ncbi:MAG: ferritin family protein [Desulfobaccales bacterium]
MRKELVDLIQEAMDQHELARDFYHRLAHRVSHADTREMFKYLAKEAEENKARLHQCLTPDGCPVVPPVHDVHLAEHLQVPKITEDLSPKDALALAIKRSDGLCRFYQSLVELQPEGEIRRRLDYLARAESSHKEKLENLYDTVAFPEAW